MSEYINENPDVLDESDLPKRAEDASNQLLLNGISNKTTSATMNLWSSQSVTTTSSFQK